MYYEAKEAGLDGYNAQLFAALVATPAALGDKYSLGALLGGMQGSSRAAMRDAIIRTIRESGGKVTASTVLSASKAATAVLLKASAPEALGEGGEYLVEEGMKQLYNALGINGAHFETVDNYLQFAENFVENSVGGFMGGVTVGIPAAYKTIVSPKLSEAARRGVSGEDADKNDKAWYALAQQMLDSGEISQSIYDKAVGRYESMKEFFKTSLPKSITNESAIIQAGALLQEKKELAEIIKTSDKALAVKEAQRITEIDRMLGEIADNNRPVHEPSVLEVTDTDDPTTQMVRETLFGPMTEEEAAAQAQAEPGASPIAEPVAEPVPETPPTPAPIASPAAPKRPRGVLSGRQLRKKKVSPKRTAPSEQTPTTPQGVPVTATVEEQQAFADTKIEEAVSRTGAYVNYQGVEGTMDFTEDGLPAVKTNDGSYYVIEGAIPGRSMAEIGLELVRPFDTMSAMTPDELQAVGEVDTTDATAVDTDFSTGRVSVYGNDYDFVSTNTDQDNDVVSVTLRDRASGKEVTVRNQNIVHEIDGQRIRHEMESTSQITPEAVSQAAEAVGAKPVKDAKKQKQKAPAGKGRARAGKVQPAGQAQDIGTAGRQPAASAEVTAQREQAALKAAQDLGMPPAIAEAASAAIASALKTPESAKAFIKLPSSPRVKSMFEAASGIKLSEDQAANEAAVDALFGMEVAPQISQTQQQNAVQEQATGQVPVQSETRVGEALAQGEPQAEPQVPTQAQSVGGQVPEAPQGQVAPVAQVAAPAAPAPAPVPAPSPSPSPSPSPVPAPAPAESPLATGQVFYDSRGNKYTVKSASATSVDFDMGGGYVNRNVPRAKVDAALRAGTLAQSQQEAAPFPVTDTEVTAPTPQEAQDLTSYKVANIRDLYIVNRNLFNRSRVQSVVAAVIMDRLIKRRASLLGITPEQMYSSIEFKKAKAASSKASPGVKFQLDLMHGSSHLFEKFSLSNMGGGEGFQMYMHGIYFTDAERYRQIYARASQSQFKISFTDPSTGTKYSDIPLSKIQELVSFGFVYNSFVNQKTADGELFIAKEGIHRGLVAGHVYLVSEGDAYDLTAGEYPSDADSPLTLPGSENSSVASLQVLSMKDLYVDIVQTYGVGEVEDVGAFMEARFDEFLQSGDSKAAILSDLDKLNTAAASYLVHGIDVSEEQGVSVGDLAFATEVTSNRFLDYLSSLYPGAQDLGAKLQLSVDTSSYSYWVSAFNNDPDYKSKILDFEKVVPLDKKRRVAELIREKGLNRAAESDPENIALQTKQLIADIALKWLDGSTDDGVTLSQQVRPLLLEYFNSVNQQLAEYGLEMMVLPPYGRDSQASVVLVDTGRLSPMANSELDANYLFYPYLQGFTSDPQWAGDIPSSGWPTGASSALMEIPPAVSAIQTASFDNESEIRFAANAGGFPIELANEVIGAMAALNESRAGMNMITLGSIGSPLQAVFDEDLDNATAGTLLGRDLGYILEHMFTAEEGSSLKNYARDYFSQPLEARTSYQKKATDFLMEAGYLAASHIPKGSAYEGEVTHYVKFTDEDIDIKNTLKFQHEHMRTATPIKFAADAQTVLHSIVADPSSDPIAMLVGAFETYLSEDERAVVVKAAKTGTWNASTSEFFRNHFLQYLAKGKTPFTELQKVFDKFKEWFKDVVSAVTGVSPAKVKISEPMRKLYDNMLAPVNGKVDVPQELNPPSSGDAPMPEHAIGDTYMGAFGAVYTVAGVDQYGNTTLTVNDKGGTVVWTKEMLAEKLDNNELAKVTVLNPTSKSRQRNSKSKSAPVPASPTQEEKPVAERPKKPDSPKTTAKTAAAQTKAAKSGKPATAKRAEQNNQTLAAAPSEMKKVKNRNGLAGIYESLFGLDKRKAKVASLIADRILKTIADRAGITLAEAYERISYARASGVDLAARAGIVFDNPGQMVFRGAMEFISDAEAVIYALENPNVSTPLHELAHVYEKYLSDAEKATISAWVGAAPDTTAFSEGFARGFERYLYTGNAPSLKLKALFEKFAKWLQEIYGDYAANDLLPTLNEDMRSIYAVMLGEKPTIRKAKTVIEDADVSVVKSPRYAKTGKWSVTYNGQTVGQFVYNRITLKWEGIGKYADLSFSKKSDVVNEIVTRHNNDLIPQAPPAPAPVAPAPATPITPPPSPPLMSLPPVTVGFAYTDTTGQEFKVVSVSGETIRVNRVGTNSLKTLTVQALSEMYGNGEIKVKASKAAAASKVKGIDADISDLAKAMGQRVRTLSDTGQLGPRGEMVTNQEADELYDLNEKNRLNPGGTRMVYRLPGNRVIKVIGDNTQAGRVQNLAEGIEDFTPMVYESGLDYVIVEELPPPSSANFKNFASWLSKTKAEDWIKKPEAFREKLAEFGLEKILDKGYSLAYGDITAIENWGERDGKIMLVDAGSLVAGYQVSGSLDKAEQVLAEKTVATKEVLATDAPKATVLFQAAAPLPPSPWQNLIATNRQAHKAVVKMTKKIIKANGKVANDVANILIDTIAQGLPDMPPMPKDIAFDYVIKGMSELGIQPDYTGMAVQPDEIELSVGDLNVKTVFTRVQQSKKVSGRLRQALTRAGRLYDVENQGLASELANAIIEEYGPRAAMAMVKAGIIKGATSSFIYGAVIDKMSSEGSKYSEIAEVINDFALHQRELGRGIAALNEVYVRSPQGLYYMALHAMNQTNAVATASATGAATALSGQLAAAQQSAAATVATNIARGATSGTSRISTDIPDLIIMGQQEKMKALKKEANDILRQLKGLGSQLPFAAPTGRIQALQSLGKLDLVVSLGANFIKRGNVQFSIWAARFKKSLSSAGITFDKDDLQYVWETNEVKKTLQDTLDSGLAPLDGPIRDYLRSTQTKLAAIVRKRAADRTISLQNLADDIAASLAVDPVVASRLSAAILADIDKMSKAMQQKIVEKFHKNLTKKFGGNKEAAEASLADLVNLVNMNQANPHDIAEAIKFAFGGVSMSDSQSDQFIKLAEDVFKTREGSRNRQIAQKRLVEFTNSLYKTKFGDLFWIFFYPNQLAGISTQVVNTIGNFYNTLAQMLIYAHTDIRNAVRMGLGTSLINSLSELSQQVGAGLQSAKLVMETGIAGSGNKYADLKAATKNSKTIEDDLGYKIQSFSGLSTAEVFPVAVRNLFNGFMLLNQAFLKYFPVRFMTAVDNAFYQATYEKSIRRQYINELYEQGLRGKALRDAVYEAMHGTDTDVQTAAQEAYAEMVDAQIPFFDNQKLADYILAKQLSGEIKAAINSAIGAGSGTSPLPPLAELMNMLGSETTGPLMSAALIQADPSILAERSLWSTAAKVAVREIIHSRSIPEHIADRASRQSMYVTLKNTPEGFLGVIAAVTSMAVNTFAPIRFLVPYVNVPFNIANMFLDWFPLTSVPRAAGLSLSRMFGPTFLQRFGVKPSSYSEGTAVQYGLEYDPVMHQEQKVRAMYSTLIGISTFAYYVSKALGDDEEEEGPAITGGLFNVRYDRAGKTQKPYTIKIFGEEFSYENTPLYLVLASVGNTCDIIRQLKAEGAEQGGVSFDALISNSLTSMTYTALSLFDALPISGLEGIMGILSSREKGAASMGLKEKALLRTAQGLIKSLLTPVPIVGNNFVKQLEQFNDPRKYVNDVYDPEVFLARATGHVLINTLSDGSLVMRDYLGREVVQYPGARNIKTLEIAEKSDIDRYIYSKHLNFIPVSKDSEVAVIAKGPNGRESGTLVKLTDDVQLFNEAYTAGGTIMRKYLGEFLPLLKSLNDTQLEREIINQANEWQRKYVIEKIEDAEFSKTKEGFKASSIPDDISVVFSGWGRNREYADGVTRISENGSILNILRDINKSPVSARESKLRDLRAVLNVKTESERVRDKIREEAERRNLNVNNLDIVVPE